MFKSTKKERKNSFITNFFGSKEFLYFYILHLLNTKSMYGEEISKTISSLINGYWYPNPGFIYPMLKKLGYFGYIKGQWVAGESKHPRLVYEITEEGRLHYTSLKEDWFDGLKEFILILKALNKEEGE